MNENIASLIKLQDMDTELDGFLSARAKIAPQREKIMAEEQGLQARFEESKKALTEAQVAKKNLELDIEAKDQVVRKSSGELNSVKSNDAYKALISQVEEAKKAKVVLEDQVLDLMEKIDALQKEIKEREKGLQQEKSEMQKRVSALDAEEQRLVEDHERKKAERESFSLNVPADMKSRYEAIRRGRQGFAAVVPVKGMICGGCRTHLPPSVVNEVMKGKAMVVCEDCSRILFMAPPEPVPAK